MKSFILSFCLVFIHYFMFAQEGKGQITGEVISDEGNPVFGAYLRIKDNSNYAITNENGHYELSIKPGEYEVIVSTMGYLESRKQVQVKSDKEKELNFNLTTDPEAIEKIELFGKSALTEVKESSFNVTAVDAEAFHNSTLDISQVLEKSSGVKVRRNGGLGSDYNVMLNGFTGRHVKYFIDGVPMEGFSSAFDLNNIPVNLAKRIEVYKGVVPINFGSDALGGAINIVTEGGSRNFLDASYSYGSFNTHKSFLNTAYTSDSGFRAQFTAFQNYSDNNYKVDADIADLENHKFTGDIRRVRRFHDMYRNYTLKGDVGFVNKSFADALLIGFTYGDEYNEIQHPAYMKIAFGQKYMTSQTLMPSLTYRKKNLFIDNLDVSVTANYNFGKLKNIDDSYRRYNWLGEFIETDSPGEFNYSKTHMDEENGAVNANISYMLKDKHAFTLNNVLNTFSRKSRNEVEPSGADDYPSETLKDIVGLGYKFQPNKRFNVSVFSKYYYNKVNDYADPNASGDYKKLNQTTEDIGYGIATSYFLLDNLQLKSSYEKAFRVPTARELFGAGNDFELGNPDLKSESSDNFNLGLNYELEFAQRHLITIEGSFIYRDIKDFIRQVSNPSDGVMKPGNEALVKNRGLDFGLTYNYDNFLTVGITLSYQDLRNKLKYKTGKNVVSTIYNDRIPNKPYLYGNSDITLNFTNIFDKTDRLNFAYYLNYVHNFDYSYESYGGIKIPTQISHDIALNYSLKNGRYNIAFSANNLFDKNLYDNFSLQKPGRNFSIKLRYFIDKF